MFINPVLHLIITSTGNTNGYPKPIISPTVNPVLQAMADWSTGSYLLFAVLRIFASTPYLIKCLGYSVTFSLFKVSVFGVAQDRSAHCYALCKITGQV